MNETPSNAKGRLTVAIIVTLVLVIVTIYFAHPIFRIRVFRFTGLRTLDEHVLLEQSGLYLNQTIFWQFGGSIDGVLQHRYGRAEAKILDQNKNLRDVRITLNFPGVIDIDVDERIEIAYLRIDDGYLLIDRDGVAFKHVTDPPVGVPVIEGVRALSMNLGVPVQVDVPDAFESALALMAAVVTADLDKRIDLHLITTIQSIRPVSADRFYLTIVMPDRETELPVIVANNQYLQVNMSWLRYVLQVKTLDAQGDGILDLSGKQKVFRPKTE